MPLRPILPLAALALTACQPAPPTPVVGLANPASVHCARKGGTSVDRTDATGGAYADCHLPDGRVVEEWVLFREDNP